MTQKKKNPREFPPPHPGVPPSSKKIFAPAAPPPPPPTPPPPRAPPDSPPRTPMLRHLLEDNLDPVLRLATLSSLRVTADHLDPQGAIIRSTAAFDLRIAFSDII